MQENKGKEVARELNPEVAWEVSAKTQYIEGPLEGLTIDHGWYATFPTMAQAYSALAWLHRVHVEKDFIRAAGTGNAYRVISNPELRRCNRARVN